MSLGFAIIFHSDRIGNLEQMLRLLAAREKCAHSSEITLVCQDQVDRVRTDFKHKLLNMNLQEYNRPIMCNQAVKNTNSKIIALLDGDRILPESYFETFAGAIRPGEVISCDCLLKLKAEADDEKIRNEKVPFKKEFRVGSNGQFRKNAFSGNTLIHRSDYLDMGGMDERFVGYGFNDNDATVAAIRKGYKIKIVRGKEIHLCHESPESFDEKAGPDVKKCAEMVINGLRFSKKWRIRLDSHVLQLIGIVMENLEVCPHPVRDRFLVAIGKKIF
jgi:hypothetical protein